MAGTDGRQDQIAPTFNNLAGFLFILMIRLFSNEIGLKTMKIELSMQNNTYFDAQIKIW